MQTEYLSELPLSRLLMKKCAFGISESNSW